MQFTRYFMHKKCDRNAPGTLPRDAPIRALGEHAIDSSAAPVRHPFHTLHRCLCGREQAVARHTDKPLRCCPKNNRRFVAPAMRVTVLKRLMTQKHITLSQCCNNVVIGFKDMLACKDRRIRMVNAISTYRIIDLQVITTTHLKILKAVCRSSMNATGTRFGRHMITQYDGYRRIAKGRHEHQSL